MIIALDKMRHSAEVAIHFRSNDRFLHRASDHNDLANEKFQGLLDRVQTCHIYMIGKRPRVSIVLGTVNLAEEHLQLTISFRLRGEEFRFPISYPRHLFRPEEASFEAAEFLHRELISRNGTVFELRYLACRNRKAAMRQAFSSHQSFGGCESAGDVICSLI